MPAKNAKIMFDIHTSILEIICIFPSHAKTTDTLSPYYNAPTKILSEERHRQ